MEHLDLVTLALLSVGVVGGIVNAVAGGATLITFPVLMAVGLPPVTANASNAVAVSPGHLLAALADWRSIPPFDRHLWTLLTLSGLGGLAGAGLLLAVPAEAFVLPVPALIGLATALFAFAPRIAAASVRAGRGKAEGQAREKAGLAAAAVYGGFFGAGLGIILTALLSLSEPDDIRKVKVLKNLLATITALFANTFFLINGAVSWPVTWPMLLGALVGGYLGGYLIRVLPAAIIRTVVILAGIVMTVAYAYRFWL
jgi:uncharacterized membrane protein YfcA